MAAKMTREKRFNKLRRGHPILAVLFYFIICQIFLAVVAILLVAFFTYAVDSKLSGEIDSVKYLAGIYEQYGESEQAAMMMEAAGRDFVVRGSDGSVLLSRGENTVGERAATPQINIGWLVGKVGVSMEENMAGQNAVHVYGDSSEQFFIIGDKDELTVDFTKLSEAVRENRLRETVEANEWETGANSRVIEMPLWVGTETSDGRELIGKVSIKMQYKDIAVIMMIGAAMALLAFLVFVLLVGNLIRGIRRQRTLTNFFFTDDVTNGKNWMHFLFYAGRELRKRRNAAKRYAILHLAIVKYRNFCMCHSIAEGENLLRRVNYLLSKAMNKRECLAHVTSGSFALLLQADDEETLRHRLSGMIDSLQTVDQRHHFTFQIGVYLIEPNVVDGRYRARKDADPESYYNNACSAKATLEETDDSGIAFFDKKLQDMRQWEDTVNELQERALANEEFVVYYQPKYAPDTEELKGAEALIRWRPADRSICPEGSELVPPGMFIPIFEKNGFITQIDHYMLEHVARDQKAWLDAGEKCVPVSVNVSRAHFAEEDLAEQIRDTVDAAGTPHELIEIELTESAFFDDKNALIRTIEQLKAYGFSVSMDDFGSGYSSLNSLKDMALDVLKLDADFFRGDADEERKQIVVGEAIRLAKQLDMRVVAEGVEDRDQVDFLAGQGCDMIQGFIFARPMDKEKYLRRMQGMMDDE